MLQGGRYTFFAILQNVRIHFSRSWFAKNGVFSICIFSNKDVSENQKVENAALHGKVWYWADLKSRILFNTATFLYCAEPISCKSCVEENCAMPKKEKSWAGQKVKILCCAGRKYCVLCWRENVVLRRWKEGKILCCPERNISERSHGQNKTRLQGFPLF